MNNHFIKEGENMLSQFTRGRPGQPFSSRRKKGARKNRIIDRRPKIATGFLEAV
jgi:hypothetical protein